MLSKSLDEHIKHLRVVLGILLQHQLYAKRSKYAFGCHEVEYLVHIVSAKCMKADPKKAAAMLDWPTPFSVKP